MSTINVILSGGVGSRLWPLSRKSRPKQYLPLFQGKTLFQSTVSRNSGFCDSILVVGNKDNFELSRIDLEKEGIQDFIEIVEACPRNTAAAIAFAAFASAPEDILFITPSDHLIDASDLYSNAISRALELAKKGSIVTFGLKPKSPETGFGYIEAKEEEVLSFREKPNVETARAFLNAGNFYWNSGMFCFMAGVYLGELQKFEPEVFTKSKEAFLASSDGQLDFNLSMAIPSISVDYAVMERTDKIKVVPSNFQWSDMGSFESVYEYLVNAGHEADENGNLVIGMNKHTEFIGLENTIWIHTPDANLILKKEKSQEVKEVFERLEKSNPELV
ncbi:mannose-1-phosphate guanylyltransferase [Algoriphagus namhaensis]|uniref:Mannose-1-phosphate guanylyltransferase n=1 Tax=Algoriphagus namhaensis TaxID=915353 RepID=A0ABV8ASE2_9BACT